MKNNETLTKGIIDHNMNYRVSGTHDYFLLPTPIIFERAFIYMSRASELYQLSIYVTIFYVKCLIFIHIFSLRLSIFLDV